MEICNGLKAGLVLFANLRDKPLMQAFTVLLEHIASKSHADNAVQLIRSWACFIPVNKLRAYSRALAFTFFSVKISLKAALVEEEIHHEVKEGRKE
ncbi:MAG: hypothetical protein LBL76_08500 [Treponema sp.]|nr:hypothetical protein [Treponema sp.]